MRSGRALVLRADARALPLPDASVDLICTSPPYYGLRDYRDGGSSLPGQIGAEASPRQYVAELLACTREWMRVLKPAGSLFVVLGDSYATRWSGRSAGSGLQSARTDWGDGSSRLRSGPNDSGLPGKCLMGVPWRYAIGCTDELGLVLRAEIIWSKANGLPESVTDRAHRSHETVLHFTREPHYYSAVDDIREPYAPGTPARYAAGYGSRPVDEQRLSVRAQLGGDRYDENPLGRMPGSVWHIASEPLVVPERLGVKHFAAYPTELVRRIVAGWSPLQVCTACGQGRRPVISGEHIALRQRDLPGRARLNAELVHGYDKRAGTHVRLKAQIAGYVCACTPYTDRPELRGSSWQPHDADETARGARPVGADRLREPRLSAREYHFDRWQPAPARPGVVLDPFGGSGTTALVASVLGRTAISADLSWDYCRRIARWRVHDDVQRARVAGRKPPVVSKTLAAAESAYGDWFADLDALIDGGA